MKAVMIGAGMVARTHLLALRDNTEGVELIGIFGRDAERSHTFRREAEEMLNRPLLVFLSIQAVVQEGPDMAIVITPPDARQEIARSLAKAGIPTLMEKPVERSLRAARDIVDTYGAAGVPLGLCFQHRTRTASQRLKSMLDSGAFGEIVHAVIDVPWWRDQGYYDAPGRGSYARDGGGVMITQAIHTLDLALWLCGPVARVQAIMRTSPLHQMESEDIAAALLEFESGATGVLNATTAAYPGCRESLTLTTTRAHLRLQGDELKIHWLSGETETILPGDQTGTGGGADPMAFAHAWHQSVLEDFARAVRDSRPPLAPGYEAVHVHAVIDAMERANRAGQAREIRK